MVDSVNFKFPVTKQSFSCSELILVVNCYCKFVNDENSFCKKFARRLFQAKRLLKNFRVWLFLEILEIDQ